jgi:O-antigen/teichoic acid export membrane protein
MTGTTIAQAIPIAMSPILTRLYTPDDFGVFALFLAIISILGSVASGRYEFAIMLPERDEDAINIVALGLIITLLLTLILFMIIIFFHNPIVAVLGDSRIEGWLYFVPLAVFLIGFFNVLNYYNTRKKYYKDISSSKIVKAVIMAIVQITVGSVKGGVSGLISGQILSQVFANWQLFKNIIKDKVLLSFISLKNIWSQCKKYKDFPKFSIWSGLSNTLSVHLTNILVSTFFSVATLGFYSLVQKVLGMPSALIGSSIGQVFFQEATEEKLRTGKAIVIFMNIIKKVTMIGLISFGLLYFIVEDLFSFVFGEEWRIAGTYAQILMPLFFIRFISSTVSAIYDIFDGLKIELIWQITLLIGVVSILYFFKESDFTEFLTYFSIYTIFMYLVSIYLTFQLARGKFNNEK